ncbi:hypothetical protein LINGRAHAP2_LOCUS28090, partial [Linum grandiflorum]
LLFLSSLHLLPHSLSPIPFNLRSPSPILRSPICSLEGTTMATLQKFKHFATQCGAGNPTQSPTTSPVFHLRRHHNHRRRNTLRMLLSRGGGSTTPERHHLRAMAMFDSPPRGEKNQIVVQQRDLPVDSHRARRKLKDLFVSSTSPPFDDHRKQSRDEVRLLSDGCGGSSNSSGGGGGGGGGVCGRRSGIRPAAARFRCRLMRRAWRPVLVTIPE